MAKGAVIVTMVPAVSTFSTAEVSDAPVVVFAAVSVGALAKVQ